MANWKAPTFDTTQTREAYPTGLAPQTPVSTVIAVPLEGQDIPGARGPPSVTGTAGWGQSDQRFTANHGVTSAAVARSVPYVGLQGNTVSLACYDSGYRQQLTTDNIAGKINPNKTLSPTNFGISEEDRAAVSRSIDIINAAIAGSALSGNVNQPIVANNISVETNQQIPSLPPQNQHGAVHQVEKEHMSRKPERPLNPYVGRKRAMECQECHRWYRDKYDLVRHHKVHLRERERAAAAGNSAHPSSVQILHNVENSNVNKPKQKAADGRYVGKERKFCCAICKKCYVTKWDLTRHEKIHTRQSWPQNALNECTLCQKLFRDRSGLTRHQKTHLRMFAAPTNEVPKSDRNRAFHCVTCGKCYVSKWDLNRHERRHGERTHKCSVCDKAFFDASHLKCHTRIHTGDRPYKCFVCEKTFNRNYELKRHVRSHTNIRPYVCDTCNKSFLDNSHLKAHYRIHTGVKPFPCERCTKTFARRYDVKRHMKSHMLVGEQPTAIGTAEVVSTVSSTPQYQNSQMSCPVVSPKPIGPTISNYDEAGQQSSNPN